MAIKLPHQSERKATRPAATRGFDNGDIPVEHLVPCGLRTSPGGRELVMVEPAARAMRAMVAASKKASGVKLASSGTWRSYQQQVNLFTQRYTRQPGKGRSKSWKGLTYWKKPGFAGAASPGTSNHGKGLAADLSRRDWRTDMSAAELKWLAANGPRFGFWNTVSSEAWHWAYCLGDDVSDAVIGTEKKMGIKVPQPVRSR